MKNILSSLLVLLLVLFISITCQASSFFGASPFLGAGIFQSPNSDFNPEAQGDLRLWYDETGMTAAAWPNQAATGVTYDLAQATSGQRPTLTASQQNGFPALVFDGADDRMSIANDVVLDGDFTITFLSAPNVTGSQSNYFGHSSGTGRIRESSWIQSQFTNDAGTSVTLAHAPLDTHEHVITFVRNSTTVTRYVDGIVDGAATVSGTITVNTLGRQSGEHYKGKHYEILLWKDALDTTKRKLAEAYLREKYNVGKYIIVMGLDSGARGDGITDLTTTIQARLATHLKDEGYISYVIYNEGVAGTNIVNSPGGNDDLNGDLRAASASGIDNKDYSQFGAPPILLLSAMGNDLGAANATLETRMVTYLTNRKASAAAYSYIFGMTLPPIINTGTTTVAFSWNSHFLASSNITNAGMTAKTNINTLSQFDADGDYNDTTYYQGDKLHVTGNATALIEPLIYNAIEPYLE